MESGRVGFKARDLIDLLTLYGVTDEQMQAKLLAMAQQASRPDWWSQYGDILPGWFESYLGLESVSSTIRTFELQFVNGLFQTQDYARAVTLLGNRSAPPSEIERRVRLRLRRQELLAGKDPRRISAIMDEAVLRRPVGGAAVMRAQMHHLIDAAGLPHVTLQVLPLDRGGHAGPAARSPCCASKSPTCRTRSTSSSSPAPSTWTSAWTWNITWRSWTSSATRR